MNRRELLRTSMVIGASSWLPLTRGAEAQPASQAPASINERMAGNFSPVHDPCIIKAGDTYHLFCTGHVGDPNGLIPWRVSKDLIEWTRHGHVLDAIPQWAQAAVPGTRGAWAPDIACFNGRYHLYYSCSTFGSNRSAIGLLTNATLDRGSPEYRWEDQGLVVASHQNDDFNAIDANHLLDRDGQHWLCLGSFWSGIKLFPLDGATGKLAANERRKYSLASRPVPAGAPNAIEAPFLIERDGFYYLFSSFDYCCRGASSSYYVVVGRSRSVLGPYVGKDGKSQMDGYGTVVLRGDRRYRGPGHVAVLRDGPPSGIHARDYLVYHAYDAQQEGRSVLRIATIDWTPDGWPLVNA